eukprot:CAMPEP_0118851090 /NCGR_PEP_ID=MMETSP1163-20130328/662_1 /TAXON_ID=124430 /ORGANISM="Phaeomonas parva, Strain CCMP2877" /LENGTH=38 /DNA_ID= /DNA_START= /DNA_END= /DNA_ORIENTATION=
MYKQKDTGRRSRGHAVKRCGRESLKPHLTPSDMQPRGG